MYKYQVGDLQNMINDKEYKYQKLHAYANLLFSFFNRNDQVMKLAVCIALFQIGSKLKFYIDIYETISIEK